MNIQRGSTNTLERLDARNGSETRLHGSLLLIARVSWIVLTLFLLTCNIVLIPRYDALLQAHCQPGTQCFAIQLSVYDRQLLHQFGLSLGFLAAYQVILDAGLGLVFCMLGALIFWRKSADRMALFSAFALVLFSGSSSILQDTLMPVAPAWFVLIGALAALAGASFVIFFLLFPSGRFVPHWSRWIALGAVLSSTSTTFSMNNASAWSNMVFFSLLLFGVGTQVYRYRRVSTPRERQQTKLVVFSFCISIVGFVLFIILGNAWLPPVYLQSSAIGLLAANTVINVFLLLIPISIAIAILRYRLWDIDAIINKALVYGTLTVLLATVYVGLVIGLGSLVRLFTGQLSQSPVAIVVSTLAIAALFQPLRHRIQQVIDRRFYRRKYDAAKTLEAFSATLRNEVDLNQLCEQLLEVVQETMQPTHVSLWLRRAAPAGKHQMPWSSSPLFPEGGEQG